MRAGSLVATVGAGACGTGSRIPAAVALPARGADDQSARSASFARAARAWRGARGPAGRLPRHRNIAERSRRLRPLRAEDCSPGRLARSRQLARGPDHGFTRGGRRGGRGQRRRRCDRAAFIDAIRWPLHGRGGQNVGASFFCRHVKTTWAALRSAERRRWPSPAAELLANDP